MRSKWFKFSFIVLLGACAAPGIGSDDSQADSENTCAPGELLVESEMGLTCIPDKSRSQFCPPGTTRIEQEGEETCWIPSLIEGNAGCLYPQNDKDRDMCAYACIDGEEGIILGDKFLSFDVETGQSTYSGISRTFAEFGISSCKELRFEEPERECMFLEGHLGCVVECLDKDDTVVIEDLVDGESTYSREEFAETFGHKDCSAARIANYNHVMEE